MLLLLSLAIAILIGGYATKYVIDVWGTVLKKRVVDVPLFVAVILGLFVSAFTIPAAVITWLSKEVF